MNVLDFIVESNADLIPALYCIGMIIKRTKSVPDKYIPLILLGLGITGSVALNGLSAVNVIQGVLIAASTTGINQVGKQLKK